jgi:hypothetical protein
MPMDSESNERGALVLKQDAPLYGRMTLLVSDAFTFDVTETQQGLRLDFRRRTLRERLEVWRRKWGL